jgi:hypothetical protein
MVLRDKAINILTAPYRYYKGYIYYKVDHLRGSHFIFRNLQNFAYSFTDQINEEGEHIADKEWNNLVIFDACRHDIYEEVFRESDYRISVSSCSKEFIRRTFSEETFEDTVVITANPHYYENIFEDLTGRKPEEVFHSVYNTYKTKWNEEEGVVMPESVMEDVRSAKKLFPDKRLLIHFMQPHIPFINSQIPQKANYMEGVDKEVVEENFLNEFEKAQIGKVSREKVLEDYRDNLEILREAREELKQILDGKAVITADHGEMLGEQKLYGHPCSKKSLKLRKVPWDDLGK